MFKKEIKPLSESMANAIVKSINKLEHVEESVSFNGRTFKDYKTFNSDKEANGFLEKNDDYGVIGEKGGKVYVAKMKDMGEEVELEEAAMEGNYARVMYDYREDYYNITVYKNGKAVAKDDGYFGANETGNPLIKKFTDAVKKAGLKPEGLPIVDEDGKKGVFKGNKFNWNVKEEADANSIGQALMKKHGEGSKVVKKSGRYYIKYTKNNNEVIIGPFNDLDDVMKHLKEETEQMDEIAPLVGAAAKAIGGAIVRGVAKRMTRGAIKKSAVSSAAKGTAFAPTALNQNEEVELDEAMGHIGAIQDMMKKEREAQAEKLKKKSVKKEAMDPVGKEDSDIDNDGDVDSSDKYLHARRKAIGKAMKNRKMEEEVELDEKLAAHTVRGDTYVGVPDRVVAQAKDKVKKMNPSTASEHQKAMNKVLSDMGWEMTAGGKYVKEEVELDEGYTIYHKTFSSAVQHAKAQVEKQGYTIDDDEWDRKVAMGPKKPGTGKTNRYTIDLMKGGKETPRKLQMQVYYDEGRYELNMYVS